ncbi:zinc ribbon domain-containing protein [Streptomyces sp. 2A115]|uniref:zinc ribbon domain-containing protein n=1 Tax=Streptomyces sp. 2A115 TaxID=3457439 RepID=UPI003FCEF9ED
MQPIGRFTPTSQICPECGVTHGPKPLHIRTWTCAACGAVHDRAHNAAKNVRTAAGLAVAACGTQVRPDASRRSATKQKATDSRPETVPHSGTATDEKARMLGLQPEEQVNQTGERSPGSSFPRGRARHARAKRVLV